MFSTFTKLKHIKLLSHATYLMMNFSQSMVCACSNDYTYIYECIFSCFRTLHVANNYYILLMYKAPVSHICITYSDLNACPFQLARNYLCSYNIYTTLYKLVNCHQKSLLVNTNCLRIID